jgi:hypothetical protein
MDASRVMHTTVSRHFAMCDRPCMPSDDSGSTALQGPFATAAELLAAFQQGQLTICSLPVSYTGTPSAIEWSTTEPFKAPQTTGSSPSVPPAIPNSGLQSQVHLQRRWRRLFRHPCSPHNHDAADHQVQASSRIRNDISIYSCLRRMLDWLQTTPATEHPAELTCRRGPASMSSLPQTVCQSMLLPDVLRLFSWLQTFK